MIKAVFSLFSKNASKSASQGAAKHDTKVEKPCYKNFQQIDEEVIESAKSRAEAYVAKHAWHAAKEFDEFLGHDSKIGDKPMVYARGAAGLRSGEATTNFMDIVGNSLNHVFLAIHFCQQDNGRDDLVKLLAQTRVEEFMDYTDYAEIQRNTPSSYISQNQGHKYMIDRMLFDKFVEELGGYSLKIDMMREVANIIESKGISLAR